MKLAEHFTDSMIIKINEDSFSFQIMDDSHTCLLIGTIPKDTFKTYNLEKESELSIFISVFIKCLSISGPKPLISWEWDNNDDHITLHVEPENKKKYQSFYGEVKTLDLGTDKRLHLPETEWLTYKVKTELLKRAVSGIRKLDVNCRSIYIHPYKNKIKIMANTEHVKNANTYINIEERDDDSDYDFNQFENISYQVTLLTKVIDTISNISETMEISWCVERPLFIKVSDFEIYISPIIEDTY